MKGKLITDGKNNYSLLDYDNELIGTTMKSSITYQRLSLKNCEEIANGYDLEKIIKETLNTSEHSITDHIKEEGFVIGFKKAIEIIEKIPNTPDPKLIDSMCMRYRHDFGIIKDEAEKNSLRVTMTQLWEEVVGIGFYAGKTEWDVEIEMEKVSDGLDEMAQNQYSKQPKLDADGCLILKRK